MEYLTADKMREYLHRALEEKGADYIYEQPSPAACYYLDYNLNDDEDGGHAIRVQNATGPGCLIGHVAYYAGMAKEDLAASEGTPADRLLRGHAPDAVRLAARALQRAQDQGESWGTAVQAFENCLRAMNYLKADS
jgi:hypothetical protein